MADNERFNGSVIVDGYDHLGEPDGTGTVFLTFWTAAQMLELADRLLVAARKIPTGGRLSLPIRAVIVEPKGSDDGG